LLIFELFPPALREATDIAAPIIEAPMIEPATIEARAKALFGITHNPLEAGYVLADGSMLDLSGRHQVGDYQRAPSGENQLKRPGRDWMADTRHVDHREVNDLYEMGNGTQAMLRFMAEAPAARFFPKIGFEVNVMPTPKLIAKAVAAHFALTSEPIQVDVSDQRSGQILDNKAFARSAVTAIMPFIKTGLNKKPI